ncbi:hypothetical protein SELMODRAFT_442850 [Selaginella moellendorffii]|uniref:Katanin p80 WD40 repeat-containing subunit B1 homolog n=1 Tax=Selaginella moellendorffii TaxID=88036 RepID=D8RWL8_SELML|nr:hypothetical protein SELMODRAFT_442850 [Selaginella moellendorffii]
MRLSMKRQIFGGEEFVAHGSDVNCLKIGKKSSRVLVTGGEDHKVNMWAIGKPNAILSLSGHTSGVESVAFDAAEVLVVAGAASGTIKLWDLEEAKIVRTLTGHRSNCISVDFHPFGEFFASGSLDTNLKIWDIRRKGCIHTYKGHTRGVKCVKFSPDGRWIVSGGEDNVVKLWDLTAGKLIHDFKYHEAQIQCLDFHPHEFLLASGSADKTVKFYDLETFELIGSSGPETSGVRVMGFNPDGRTIVSATQENLKVLSWEPLRYHDAVDVGWSKIADLSIHEGKLLGCSFNQSCVGVWVVDLTRATPLQVSAASRTNSVVAGKAVSNITPAIDSHVKNPVKTSMPQPSESVLKEVRTGTGTKLKPDLDVTAVENAPNAPNRVSTPLPSKALTSSYVLTPRKGSITRVQSSDSVRQSSPMSGIASRPASGLSSFSENGHAPTPRQESTAESIRKSFEGNGKINGNVGAGDSFSPRVAVIRSSYIHPDTSSNKTFPTESDDDREEKVTKRHTPFSIKAESGIRGSISDDRVQQLKHCFDEVAAAQGDADFRRSRSFSAQRGRKERDIADVPITVHVGRGKPVALDTSQRNSMMDAMEKPAAASQDETDALDEVMQQHYTVSGTLQTRLAKLQMVRRLWFKNDLKAVIDATSKMADNSVLGDLLSILTERSDMITLEVCSLLLPLLNTLLHSNYDRHITTSLSMLSLLVKSFGPLIHNTLTASPSIGVDVQLEERHARCSECYKELQAIKQSIAPLMRKSGEISKTARDLNVALSDL